MVREYNDLFPKCVNISVLFPKTAGCGGAHFHFVTSSFLICGIKCVLAHKNGVFGNAKRALTRKNPEIVCVNSTVTLS